MNPNKTKEVVNLIIDEKVKGIYGMLIINMDLDKANKMSIVKEEKIVVVKLFVDVLLYNIVSLYSGLPLDILTTGETITETGGKLTTLLLFITFNNPR